MIPKRIEIWNPRWHDKVVLVAKYKVEGFNEIVFTKGTLKGRSCKIKGEDIEKYPIESNGKIDCYAVPLERLVPNDD